MIDTTLSHCVTNLPRTSWSSGATLTDTECQYSWSQPSWPSVNPIVKENWNVLILGATIVTPPQPGQPPYVDGTYGSYAYGLWGEIRCTIGGFWQVPYAPEPSLDYRSRNWDRSKPYFLQARPGEDLKNIFTNPKSGYVSADISSSHY
jgi:hypothetical protein